MLESAAARGAGTLHCGRHRTSFGAARSCSARPSSLHGPYTQSARAQTYLTYVRELLRQGRAYVDFTTRQDLEEISARQREAGALPGYYGKWATWRDADPDEVAKRLAAGEPYAVRFRSPGLP